MFLRNAWYVAARENDVADKPVPVKILNEKIVLFRKTDGQVAALEDACPHRKLPLSMGRIKGDEIECGYHGMMFDCSGSCTRAPATDRPPPGARVRSYPMAVRYGLLWIWMGDAALADSDTIFAVEHWGDPAWGMNQGDGMEIACNYLYMTDNLLDPTHVAWVHQSSFASAACEDTPLQTTVADSGVTVWRWMNDVDPAPFYAPFLKFKGRCDRKQQYEVRYPSHALIKAIFTPAGTGGEGQPLHEDVFIMDSYNFMTPIDENTTKYYWFQMRNFAPDDAEVSRQFATSVRGAFEEDRVILQAVHQGLAEKTSPNIDLKIDVGPLRFRRRLAQLIEAERAQAAQPAVAETA
ncbi:(2Fe-2S)-binding protein [Acidovorax sp. SRB_14]|uniref:aromatic ring-hydroxylating dioxygenase subunit alpha n=1 Tax=Acidovorax sp. SRB_14 TaxID=1962699 RepID=UPI00156798EA|nr:aromatic ring-hydroxylating dioxygenase subunit alpha [Acidovorax sp. SRB_14]NMM80705.1 (2Fe-2S)-binding protein [Acidovorax sp. SRB_14]